MAKPDVKSASYIVAYRFLEQAVIQLERINTPLSNGIAEKLKQGKRDLEDVIW
jgi:hypothetical protein